MSDKVPAGTDGRRHHGEPGLAHEPGLVDELYLVELGLAGIVAHVATWSSARRATGPGADQVQVAGTSSRKMTAEAGRQRWAKTGRRGQK